MHLIGNDELAKLLGVPRNTPAQWRCKGVGPAWLKLGKLVRYRIEDVEQWIAENRRASADEVVR